MDLEDQYRFRVEAILTFGPDLSVQCTRCHRWTNHIGRPLTLAELNQRADDGVCAGMEPADRICVSCTAIIDSNTEFGPWFGPSVEWPCPVITSAAGKYGVHVEAAAA